MCAGLAYPLGQDLPLDPCESALQAYKPANAHVSGRQHMPYMASIGAEKDANKHAESSLEV